jgi:hypothetical protein
LQLSDAELMAELDAAAEHVRVSAERRREYLTLAERNEREDAARAHRSRQADLGRRHGLQQAILAAARVFRARGLTAKDAWRAIEKEPFRVSNGSTVTFEQGKMRQRNHGGMRERAGIKFDQWTKRYWSAAGKQ